MTVTEFTREEGGREKVQREARGKAELGGLLGEGGRREEGKEREREGGDGEKEEEEDVG